MLNLSWLFINLYKSCILCFFTQKNKKNKKYKLNLKRVCIIYENKSFIVLWTFREVFFPEQLL